VKTYPEQSGQGKVRAKRDQMVMMKLMKVFKRRTWRWRESGILLEKAIKITDRNNVGSATREKSFITLGTLENVLRGMSQ
jgi:hypothetical protein